MALYAFGIPFLGYLVLRRNISDMTYQEVSPCIVHEFDDADVKDGLKLIGDSERDDAKKDAEREAMRRSSITAAELLARAPWYQRWFAFLRSSKPAEFMWGIKDEVCTCPDANRRENRDRYISRYGFLFSGFETRSLCPFWEVMPVTLRKVLLLVIVVLMDGYGIVIQAMMALVLVFCALMLHVHFSPYDADLLDRLEFWSLSTSFITLLMGVFFTLRETPAGWLDAIMYIVLIMNGLCFGYIVISFIRSLWTFLPGRLRKLLSRSFSCKKALVKLKLKAAAGPTEEETKYMKGRINLSIFNLRHKVQTAAVEFMRDVMSLQRLTHRRPLDDDQLLHLCVDDVLVLASELIQVCGGWAPL
jgi:hypothetical protein